MKRQLIWIAFAFVGVACETPDSSFDELEEIGTAESAVQAGEDDDGHEDDGHDDDGHDDGGEPDPNETENERIKRGVAHSCCGFPGDRGNEFGVGEFCVTDKHCAGNQGATLCSSIENDLTDHVTFFCTIPCDPAEPDVCGEGAFCSCEEVGCGCTPVACTENLPEGCDEV